MAPDSIRNVDIQIWNRIEKSFRNGNNLELLNALLELDLFPIKDGYVPYLRKDKTAIARNPQTVNRICGRIRELGIEMLYQKCSQPKETNRQMGPLFRRWLQSGALGMQPVDEDTFIRSNENMILEGSDSKLMNFAAKNFGYNRKKGLDFIARFNGKYIIGEAKFISDYGGHQNDQFNDCVTTLRAKVHKDVVKVGIIDGVLYIRNMTRMFQIVSNSGLNIMSAIILREFLYSL